MFLPVARCASHQRCSQDNRFWARSCACRGSMPNSDGIAAGRCDSLASALRAIHQHGFPPLGLGPIQAKGGLALALAECAFHSRGLLGCTVELDDPLRPDALAFGETQSRILATCHKPDLDRLAVLARKAGVRLNAIGRTGGADIVFRHEGRDLIRVAVEDAHRAWKDSLPKRFRVRS